MVTTSTNLLDRLQQPDQPQAWERFVHLYTPLLLVWAKRQGLQDVEDLVQEVLVKLLRELPKYRRQAAGSFRAWLRQVTVNQCEDFRRRKATRPLPGADGLDRVAEDTSEVDLGNTEIQLLLVSRALELIRVDFGEQTWAAFTKVMLKGRSAADTAAELGMTINAVFMARNRVLTRLRQEVHGMMD